MPLIPSEQGLIKSYFIHMEQGSLGARIISESPCAPTTLVFLFWLHSSLVPGNMASRAKVLHWATCESWARLFESLCKQILVGEACRSVEIQAHTLVSHSSWSLFTQGWWWYWERVIYWWPGEVTASLWWLSCSLKKEGIRSGGGHPFLFPERIQMELISVPGLSGRRKWFRSTA